MLSEIPDHRQTCFKFQKREEKRGADRFPETAYQKVSRREGARYCPVRP